MSRTTLWFALWCIQWLPIPCELLSRVLGSRVIFPSNPTYLSTQQSYFSLQEASLSPACIVVPLIPQDVSQTVVIISAIESCHFAIKGQTHAPAAGFANIKDGVTIDMTSLNSITVNTDHTIASIGAGASWLDVYLYLDPLGLAVAGGRNGDVGVGGLILGGGISYFAPRLGWACDNVINFEIVLASGELVDANATSHPDLFRTLKGGGNNFGVVTRFDLATFTQGQILGGSIYQQIERKDEVFKAFAHIADEDDYDIYASLVTGVSFNAMGKVWDISTTAIYTKPVLNPTVFEELLGIPTTTSTLHITNLSTLANEDAPPPLNWVFHTGTYGVSAPFLSKIFDALNQTLYEFTIPGGIFWSIAFEPMPTVAMQYGDLRGGNSLGMSPKDGNVVIMLLAALWPNSTFNALVEKTASKIMQEIVKIAREMDLLHEFQYLNYADPGQDPIGSYGPGNVRRLRETSRKFDPRGIFQRKAPGGFKLGMRY